MTDGGGAALPTRPDRAVVLAHGPFAEDERLRALASEGGWRVGVDGGAARMLEAGLVPHVVTGDFDSLSDAARQALRAAGARIVPTPDQDFTDLDKALAYCRETLGAHTIHVFGALGGRLDHTYSTLSALVKHGRHADIRLIDGIGETTLVNGRARISGPDLPGRVLSLMALGPVEGVWSRGVRWPLHGESLRPGVRDGTSNEIVAETVEIEVGSGDLLVLVHHHPSPLPPSLRWKGECRG